MHAYIGPTYIYAYMHTCKHTYTQTSTEILLYKSNTVD